ncbi:hypothetical protein VNO77_00556 [Canavalia gladiata]|uniref:Uncharacterized protein n=1 Tax=Canavalia gladiata TaxID=3824 RepID=A0AAN9MPL7_CANGL
MIGTLAVTQDRQQEERFKFVFLPLCGREVSDSLFTCFLFQGILLVVPDDKVENLWLSVVLLPRCCRFDEFNLGLGITVQVLH